MTVQVTLIENNEWDVVVDFSDEGVEQTASNHIIGTEGQAKAYGAVISRDFRSNNPDLFPPQEPEISDEEMFI